MWIVNPSCPIEVECSRQACMARYFQNIGYDVTIFTATGDFCKEHTFTEKWNVKFFYISLGEFRENNVKRALSIRKFQNAVVNYGKKNGAPEVLVSNYSGFFGEKLFRLKKLGTKIILDILDFWPEVFVDLGYLGHKSPITKFLYWREYITYSRCDALGFSVEGGAEYIKEKHWDVEHGGKVDTNHIYYVNNGIDFQIMHEDKRNYVSEDDDLEKNTFKVVYIGAIGAPNNIDMLVETAKLASYGKHEDIEFLVYGNGNQLPRLQEQVIRYKMNNIKFKGAVDNKYSPNIISRCNLSILNFRSLPTLRFGLSNNKFFLYCIAGRPILSTVRPKYELVESRKCGIVTDNSPEAILDGILKIKDIDQNTYRDFCINAENCAKEFDYANILAALKIEVERITEV